MVYQQRISKIKYKFQKYTSFCYFKLQFFNKKGEKLGKVENKHPSELKKLVLLGQKALSEEKQEEINLKDEEVIVGVRLGIREQAMNSRGKKEDGPVS